MEPAPKRARRQEEEPLSYAARLSEYENKGSCGGREWEESNDVVEKQLDELTDMIRGASYVVVHTGAGISTAAGIADFRGSNGTWTREQQGHPPPKLERCWDNASPTAAHMAIRGLIDAGKVQAVVSQNVDGLHLRSGVPSELLSELHGNLFQEICRNRRCKAVFNRSCDVGGVGLRPTGRLCGNCGGPLRDVAVDWEDALPLAHLERARKHSKATGKAGGVALCIGTSLQMTHARNLPKMANRMVIVNLQETPLDKWKKVALTIHAKADRVMRGLMRRLKLPIPPYHRVETFSVAHRITTCASDTIGGSSSSSSSGSSSSSSSSIGSSGGSTALPALELFVGEGWSDRLGPEELCRLGYVTSVRAWLQGSKHAAVETSKQPFELSLPLLPPPLVPRSGVGGTATGGRGDGSSLAGSYDGPAPRAAAATGAASSGEAAAKEFLVVCVQLRYEAPPIGAAPPPKIFEYVFNRGQTDGHKEFEAVLSAVDYAAAEAS